MSQDSKHNNTQTVIKETTSRLDLSTATSPVDRAGGRVTVHSPPVRGFSLEHRTGAENATTRCRADRSPMQSLGPLVSAPWLVLGKPGRPEWLEGGLKRFERKRKAF